MIALVSLASGTAAAQARKPAFRLDPAIDLPVLAVAVPAVASWFLAGELAPPWCAPRCDRSTINALDRAAAGAFSPGWRRVSDLSVITWGATALATLAIVDGLPNALVDATVVLESTLIANGLAVLTNYAVRRPRPFVYGDEAPMGARNGRAGLSFFSGHTANAFATTVATFQVLRRTTRPAVAWTFLGVGLVVSSFIGVTRVIAGDHFPTDVLTGALVGASFGWLVPALHRSPVRPAPIVFDQGAGLALWGAF